MSPFIINILKSQIIKWILSSSNFLFLYSNYLTAITPSTQVFTLISIPYTSILFILFSKAIIFGHVSSTNNILKILFNYGN